MIHSYKNADGSLRSDPMILRPLKKNTILEQKLAYCKITISALFRFVALEAGLGRRGKIDCWTSFSMLYQL